MATARDRWTTILETLNHSGYVDVDQIAASLNVSTATIRRDFDQLAKQQLLTRTRGGAISNSTSYDLPLRYNAERNVKQKLDIGTAAAARVPLGSVVGITGGTTTTEVARALALRAELHSDNATPGLTIVTNAINIANELAVRSQLKLVVLGGIMRPESYELVGHLADLTLNALSVNVAIVGGNAISSHGLFCHNENEAAVAGSVVNNAAEVIAVLDSTKLGQRAFAQVCDLDQINCLVTDTGADEDLLKKFIDAGVTTVIA